MISDKHRRRNRGENGRIPTSLLLVPRPDYPSRLGSTSRHAELRVILVACLMVPFASFLDGFYSRFLWTTQSATIPLLLVPMFFAGMLAGPGQCSQISSWPRGLGGFVARDQVTRPDVGVFDVSRSTGLARHPDTMIHHAQSTYCSGMLETSTVCA